MEGGFRGLRATMETGGRELRGEVEKGFRESCVVHDRDFRLTWGGIIALALGAGEIVAHFVFHLY